MIMYAVAVNGSPRKGGNTEMLLKEVLSELDAGGWETELVKVGGTAIRGCIACQKCFENKDNKCAVTTDKFNDIHEKTVACRCNNNGFSHLFCSCICRPQSLN